MTSAGRGWVGYSWTHHPAGVMPCIASASYMERPARGPSRRIVHNLWVLDYSLSDCGLARVGSPRPRWWRRAPRTAHLYPPGTPYWEDESDVDGPIREAWAIFDGGDQIGLRRMLGPRQQFARIVDPAGLLDRHLYDMASAGTNLGEAGLWDAQAALASVFGLLHCAVRQPDGTFILPLGDSASTAPTGVVERTQDYFRTHLGEKITLAAVARHLAMSPSTLSHRYSQEAGQPPMAALTVLRIDFAKGLLLRGLKMEAVALQTGFYDAFHFSKAFKKVCGVSPSQFRRDFRQSLRGQHRRAND